MTVAPDLAALLTSGQPSPALSIAVIEDGAVARAETVGVLRAGDEHRADPATLFHACSMTKLVTAVAALRLVERGALDLDKPVDRLTAGWTLPTVDGARPVTLRDLLGHVAGIDDAEGSFEPLPEGVPQPSMLDLLEGASVAHRGPVRAVRAPGAAFAYSDAGYAVVEHVLEVATGAPFADALTDLVLKPLGLATAVLRRQDPTPAPAAVGHDRHGVPVAGGWSRYPGLAGSGLWCTPTDFAAVLCDLLASWGSTGAGSGILLGAAAAQLLRPTEPEPAAGLGVFLLDRGEPCVATQGWGVGFQCAAQVFPGSGRGLVVMTNADPGVPQHASVVGRLLRASAPRNLDAAAG